MKTIKNRNVNGRPAKNPTQKLKYRITVKFATLEYYSLKSKAKKAGMTISEFVRMAIENSVVKERLSPEQFVHIRSLTGMVNNLNQIARKANAVGYPSVRTDYLGLVERVDNVINLIENDG